MEDEIINLEITMHQRSPILGLQFLVLEEPNQVLKMRQLADGLLGINIHSLRLAVANSVPRLDLTVVEPNRLAELLQPDSLVIYSVEARKCANRLAPHGRSLLRLYARHGEVLKDAAVEELHHVKGRADDGVVFTKAVGLGNYYVGILEGVHDTILAFDFVSRLGD